MLILEGKMLPESTRGLPKFSNDMHKLHANNKKSKISLYRAVEATFGDLHAKSWLIIPIFEVCEAFSLLKW